MYLIYKEYGLSCAVLLALLWPHDFMTSGLGSQVRCLSLLY